MTSTLLLVSHAYSFLLELSETCDEQLEKAERKTAMAGSQTPGTCGL
jgi:hypothetical protein